MISEIEDSKTIEYLIKIGKVEQEMLIYLNMEALSYIYGWTPNQIDEQSPEMLEIYSTILAGRNEKKETASESKTMRKQMR